MDYIGFPNAVSDWAPRELTVRETSMLTVMNLLTDKDEWRRKVFDGAIVEHWRKEAVTAKGQGFTNAMFDFVSRAATIHIQVLTAHVVYCRASRQGQTPSRHGHGSRA